MFQATDSEDIWKHEGDIMHHVVSYQMVTSEN